LTPLGRKGRKGKIGKMCQIKNKMKELYKETKKFQCTVPVPMRVEKKLKAIWVQRMYKSKF
jgi:hypothetical protein